MEVVNKYQKGKIYIIKNTNNENVYIGSTCSELHKRYYEHKKHYEYYMNNHSQSSIMTSIKIFENGDAYIELLEEFPCASKADLLKKEGEYILRYK